MRDSLHVFLDLSDFIMKFLSYRFSFILLVSVLLSACSPHPGSGVWKAIADNELGIAKLTVGFEGRAEFTTSKLDNALWHCFWTTTGGKKMSFDCTPSNNTELTKTFTLFVNGQGLAELSDESKVIATFKRIDENPSPRKK